MIGIFEDDGGDTYDLLSEVYDIVWATGGGAIAVNASAGRNAGYGILLSQRTGTNGSQPFVQKNIPTMTTAFVGFALNQVAPTEGNNDAVLVALVDGSTTQVD